MVRACPHISENQCPEVHYRQTVGIHGAAGLFGNEVIHHAQEGGGQEETHGIVAIPPLHHGVDCAVVNGVGFKPACRHPNVVHDVQQGNGQDVCAIEPVGDINVFDFACGDCSEENNGISHPHNSNQNIDRPFQLGVFFTLRQAERQCDGGQHDDELPAPEGECRQPAAEQARVTGALHHIIRCGEQAAAAKCENHCIGMQRTDTAEVEPRRDFRQVKLGPAQLRGGDNADQHPHDTPNHCHDGKLAHHFVVISLRFHESLQMHGLIFITEQLGCRQPAPDIVFLI